MSKKISWKKTNHTDINNESSIGNSNDSVIETAKYTDESNTTDDTNLESDSICSTNRCIPIDDESNSIINTTNMLESQIDYSDLSKVESVVFADKFEGVYNSDYNILNINYSIVKKLKDCAKSKLPELYEKCNNFCKLLNLELKSVQKKNILLEYNEICKNIKELESESKLTEYLQKATPFLDSYLSLGFVKKKINFKKDTDSNCNSELESCIRIDIIKQYLDVAREYIEINLINETINCNTCKLCSYVFTDSELDSIELYNCPICGLEVSIVLKNPLYLKYIPNNTYKNSYSDDKNFKKAFERFQGLQINKIPDSLLQSLDKYFSSYNFPIGSTVKEWKLNEYNERYTIINNSVITVNREMLYTALTKTNNSLYYNDINLILHLYWGFPLPDIEKYKERVLADYSLTQSVFSNIDKDRSSSLNTDFRLYKHLQLCGYKCKISQFKIIKTPSIREKYEFFWQEMCEKTGLQYIPTDW
jgi:hypothetical protein